MAVRFSVMANTTGAALALAESGDVFDLHLGGLAPREERLPHVGRAARLRSARRGNRYGQLREMVGRDRRRLPENRGRDESPAPLGPPYGDRRRRRGGTTSTGGRDRGGVAGRLEAGVSRPGV